HVLKVGAGSCTCRWRELSQRAEFDGFMLEEHEVRWAGLHPEIGPRGTMVAGNRRYLRIARVGYHDTSPGPLRHQCSRRCRNKLGIPVPPLEDDSAIRSLCKAQHTL